MRFHARGSKRFGPLRINYTERGVSSWSLVFWRLTWNSRSGWTFDTPGPGYIKGSKRRRR